MESGPTRVLVLGPFRPTLEAVLAERIRAAKASDPAAPVVVLVGSNMLALYLRRLVAGGMPLWDVRFVTFAELARGLGGPQLDEAGRRPLPDLAEQVLLEGIVRQHAAGYFEPVADLPGFVRTAAASIRDLKEAGIGPVALRRVRSPKLNAFRTFYAAYEKALDTLGFYDGADLLAAAADAAPGSNVIAGAAFIAYGFYDLNGLQRRLVAALAARAPSAAALVPAGPGPAFRYARPLVDWFSEIGFASRQADPERDPLATSLFGPATGAPADAPEVRILSTAGESREVREVVRQVLALAERGVPFHEIGVLLRHPETYARILREAFERSGIPCFLSGGVPLAETREARSLALLAHLLAGDLPRADVMQFVHFAPLAFDQLIGHVPNTSQWELLSIEAGVVEGLEGWRRGLDRLEAHRRAEADEEPGQPIDELPHLRRFIDTLIEAKKNFPARGTWAELIDALLGVYERFTPPSDGRDRVCGEVRTLAELDALGTTTTFARVRDAVTEWIKRARVPAQGFQRGKVYVGDLFQSRGLGFRAVVLPGLVEKGFPAPSRQDPILLDAERDRIGRAAGAGAFLPRKVARIAEEKTLFALAVSAGSEHVTLAYSRLEVATARERVPSHFLTRLLEAVTGECHDSASLERASAFRRVPMLPTGGGPDIDLDEFDLRTVAELVETGKPKRALFLAGVSEQFARGVRAETARWRENRFTEFDGLVAGAAGGSLAAEVMAPTRIETYAACPFVYFLRHVLGVEPLEEPERIERMPPLDRGALLHRVFRRAYARCFRADGAVSADELAAALVEAAEDELRRIGPVGPALTWAMDRAQMLRDLAHFGALDSADCAVRDARPTLFEARFGMPRRDDAEDAASTERPFALELGGKMYRFKGKIDRVDRIGEGEARVIDYKTGRSTAKPDAFAGGTALQLPLYLLAAEMLLPGRHAVAGEYAYATARGGFATVEFSREALEARRAELERIIATVEDGIEKGLFIPTFDREGCRYCEFKGACGANVEILFKRKKEDPRVAELLALREIA